MPPYAYCRLSPMPGAGPRPDILWRSHQEPQDIGQTQPFYIRVRMAGQYPATAVRVILSPAGFMR